MKHKSLLYLLILLVLTSCNEDCKNEVQTRDKKISQLKEELNSFRTENQRLESSLEYFKKTSKESQDKSNDLAFELSPIGVHLGEYYASDNNEYKFGQDSLVILTWEEGEYKVGKWHIINDTIKIKYYKELGKRGIGEPLSESPNVPGNYQDRYEKYEEYVKPVNEQDYLVWSQIRQLLKQDPEYPYKLLRRNQGLDLSDLDKELTEN